jgi:ribosomal protein S18 acetylase RimI-like enzyme
MDPRTGLPVVGMVGGGQLARMTHQAAIALGQSLRVLAVSPDDGAALVVTVQVLPASRRRGLGRRLLEECARQAAAAGYAEVRLGVHRDNPARALYEAAGFAPAGEDGAYLLYRRTAVPAAG